MAPFCSPCTSTTWPRMAASARTPAGQNGRYRNRLGGTNDTRPRQPPELVHLPAATQRIARACGDPGRVWCAAGRAWASNVSGTYPIMTLSELVEEQEEWLRTKVSVGQRKAAGPFSGPLASITKGLSWTLTRSLSRTSGGATGTGGTDSQADRPSSQMLAWTRIVRHVASCSLRADAEAARSCAVPRCPPSHPPWDSPTCNSRRCSPRLENRRTRMTSPWWPCLACWACGSSRPPARTSPTSAKSTAPGTARVRQGHQGRPGSAAASGRPG